MYWRRSTGRSNVLAKRGMIATSQPLAAQAGLFILHSGGNAIDAAIATAAVLDVVEPFSTGCGGDAFALIHLPGKSRPISFNGSGRSGSLVTLEGIKKKGWKSMPTRGGPTVTVPGAMHLWWYLVDNYGSMDLKDVLAPAIHYARNGFPVSHIISEQWKIVAPALRNAEAKRLFTINGKPPVFGQTMENPDLADTFESVCTDGIDQYYKGHIAKKIVETVQEDGGFLTVEDLALHQTVETKPISTNYQGFDVFEHPPNGQGFAALSMLNIMQEFDFQSFPPLSKERYHIMIEAKKLAYADLYAHNSDPTQNDIPINRILSKEYSRERAAKIEFSSVIEDVSPGIKLGDDTVYLVTADNEGRAVSFINSLYMGFGSGLVVPETGIKLQNRGHLFSLDPNHPNCLAPRKLPFHTIIPGAVYHDNGLFGVFGIMGGAHQAQAHGQVVSNLIDYSMTPQQALDFPRFHHDQKTNTVSLENGIPADIQGSLRKIGHKLTHETMSNFGGGQAILRKEGFWIAGSDYRKDGLAIGY
ncbi:MAG: gamma-glutamyltransferase [Candidatus Lokiarchaeota archaeon]|nr:gamma-glutamyltransferase [Candidatus Lokiarchaeota archaeon]